jgi:hypothetical protein
MDKQSTADIQQMSDDDKWALIFSGGRAYLGCSRDGMSGAFHDALVSFNPIYEITVMNIPMQGPGGQVLFNKQISSEPVLLSFEGSPVYLKVSGFCPFSEMKPGDRARYKGLADQAEKLATAARADQAGLVLPGGKLPNAR